VVSKKEDEIGCHKERKEFESEEPEDHLPPASGPPPIPSPGPSPAPALAP
jgi:hypothetical protein